MARRAPALTLLALLLAPAVATADGRGTIRVIDADTFDVGGTRVRLFGVDAPERDQTCRNAAGGEWPCGAWSVAEARARWEGEAATCVRVDTDRHGREVARCATRDGDMGAELVAAGLALAYRDYSSDYVAEERAAEAAGLGLWQGSFAAPWDHRRGLDAVEEVVPLSAPGDCAIKGNVSAAGRIYHLPGSPSYADTVIDEAGGEERWFCSVEEAEAAGWRAPRN